MNALATIDHRSGELPLSLAALSFDACQKQPCSRRASAWTPTSTKPLAYQEMSVSRGELRSTGTGRFLSVDPTIPKEAMHFPQMWNRYAYVMNNPLKYTDPTGRLFELSGCANGKSETCTAQYNLLLSSFGKQAQAAGQYLQIGSNGMLSFNGISAQAFAKQFGMMGRAMAYLISNQSATFTLEFARLSGGGEKGISFFEPNSERGMGPVGGRIVIDPSKYPADLGMVSVSAAEGFAHEIGHAVGTLIPGVRDDLDRRLSTWIRRNEGYSMAFENIWRVNVLGAAPNDLRMFYSRPGDVLAPSPGTPLFP